MDTRRFINRCFHIDANRINASGRLEFMNQLQKWHNNRIILMHMALTAKVEAGRGSARRANKTNDYIFAHTSDTTEDEDSLLEQIETALFPAGARTVNERNDVRIIFEAHRLGCILVTDDGDSQRQPGGILGNREKLRALGVAVLRDQETVELVRRLIDERDERERQRSQITGEPLPPWVGGD